MGTLFVIAVLTMVVAAGMLTGWLRLGRPTHVALARQGRHRAPALPARVLVRR